VKPANIFAIEFPLDLRLSRFVPLKSGQYMQQTTHAKDMPRRNNRFRFDTLLGPAWSVITQISNPTNPGKKLAFGTSGTL
jgi:hypothetical protein